MGDEFSHSQVDTKLHQLPEELSCLANINKKQTLYVLDRKVRLKAAIHFTVARFCEEVGQDCQKKYSKLAIAAISETTFKQCDIFARDLEAFARHAKRTTVNVEDVKLAARRSTSLANYISEKSEELTSITKEQKERRKKQTGKRTSGGSLPEAAAATGADSSVGDDQDALA